MQQDTPDSLLVGSERLKRFVAPLLAPHQTDCEHAYTERYAARPSLGSLFEGCHWQQDLDDAAYRSFVEHAYTLAEIAVVVSRQPSVICRWIQRAKRKLSRRTAVPSLDDTSAKNKIGPLLDV